MIRNYLSRSEECPPMEERFSCQLVDFSAWLVNRSGTLPLARRRQSTRGRNRVRLIAASTDPTAINRNTNCDCHFSIQFRIRKRFVRYKFYLSWQKREWFRETFTRQRESNGFKRILYIYIYIYILYYRSILLLLHSILYYRSILLLLHSILYYWNCLCKRISTFSNNFDLIANFRSSLNKCVMINLKITGCVTSSFVINEYHTVVSFFLLVDLQMNELWKSFCQKTACTWYFELYNCYL